MTQIHISKSSRQRIKLNIDYEIIEFLCQTIIEFSELSTECRILQDK